MPVYAVTKNGETNNISAEESFVLAQSYDSYELVPETPGYNPDEELSTDQLLAKDSRAWRDAELKENDIAAQTPDWPNRDNIIIYRAALRAWPASSDFPATRPVLGV